jgi:hypothetical protein
MHYAYSGRRDYPVSASLSLDVCNNPDLSAVRAKRCLRYQAAQVALNRQYIEREHFEWWFR